MLPRCWLSLYILLCVLGGLGAARARRREKAHRGPGKPASGPVCGTRRGLAPPRPEPETGPPRAGDPGSLPLTHGQAGPRPGWGPVRAAPWPWPPRAQRRLKRDAPPCVGSGESERLGGSHQLLSRLRLSFLINFAWQMSPSLPEPSQVSNIGLSAMGLTGPVTASCR